MLLMTTMILLFLLLCYPRNLSIKSLVKMGSLKNEMILLLFFLLLLYVHVVSVIVVVDPTNLPLEFG